MRVIIENYSRVPLPVAVLMVFLKLNGNSDKEKERHVVIEKQEKIDGTIFTVNDEKENFRRSRNVFLGNWQLRTTYYVCSDRILSAL